VTSVRFLEAGPEDPDRQIALKITNFVGVLPLRRAVAIYALAIGMSFRNIGFQNQTAVLWSVAAACRRTWASDQPDAADVCGACLGAGTLKADGTPIRHEHIAPEDQTPCTVCYGTGRGSGGRQQ
jgi:hypothetical protein